MNKTLKLALGAVLAVGIVMPAFAQTDNFPDVPDNHWAYEALARLKKDGLLVGYPDGLFRGNRPASRYELAVAIHATYVHLKSITDGLQAEIDALKNNPQVDLQPLKDAIAQLQDEVNNMKGWGADIDNLKKLADQFQKELASLGVDVEGLKRDLADLAKRVGVLEAHRLPFDIHGETDFFMIAGASNDHKPGITVDGRPIGVRIPYAGNTGYDLAGMDVDSTIYHELDLSLKSNNDTGPKWHGDIVVGNMISGSSAGITTASPFGTGANIGGGFSMSRTGTGPFSTGSETVYVQDLAVDFDTSIVGQGLAAELGRTGYSIDPYIFQRPDTNPYFQNDRWSNGKWYFDGGILGFHFGGVRLDAFGGKTDDLVTTNGIAYQQLSVGAVGHPTNPNGLMPGVLPINEDLGLNLKIPLGQNGKLDLAYIWFESNAGVAPGPSTPIQVAANGASNAFANRADVYGGDLKWNFGSIVFDGGYSASDVKLGNSNLTNKDNYAWHGQFAYDTQKWGAQVGYRDIQPQFGAPGDWGRIGTWWNPTDIQGPEANVHLNLSQTVKLSVAGEWLEGTGDTITQPAALGGTTTGLSHSDTIGHYTAELGFRLNDAWNLTLGTELVYWHLPVAGGPASNPTEQWYNLGLGYNLSDQARLSFLYQYSNWDSKNNTAFQPFAGSFTGSKYTGSLLTTQLTVKF